MSAARLPPARHLRPAATRRQRSFVVDVPLLYLTQVEIKHFLESVYGLDVLKVNTLNVEGKKKRGKQGFFRRPDYKKAFVVLSPPAAAAVAAGGRKPNRA